ncbi:AAA family ATPase [uncultured Eubacterium sp.]|uniref:AAA family ATPase n=1 Tax=uncultured Eubacterium sp. TaxID=165185 RepID=UPI00326315A6
MGRLAIRRVVYSGDKYSFESPYLNDGIVIMEGVNGHGKSTFMNLIYYGLGGRVQAFNKNDDNDSKKHNEIFYDTNNYVELLIEIDDEKYELTRYIGDNLIFVVGEDEKVRETCVLRNQSDEHTMVFSDWILGKLNINVFDIVQGTRSFKLNFTDLLRLVYHDQETEVDKVYKEADNSNFLSDSLEIRKAIFEILLGKTYNDYYSTLGQYKLTMKELEKAQAVMDSYDEFLGEVLDYDLANVVHINSMISENQEMIEKVQIEREIASREQGNSDEIWQLIGQQKKELMLNQHKLEEWESAKNLTTQSIDKILYLIDESEKELSEIEKIRLVNKKLKLFTPNTCPYCLREVEREKGKCICGNDIEEEQYEKFFYTDEEYLDILKVKKKSIQSLEQLLERKSQRLKIIIGHIEKAEQSIEKIRLYIDELTKDIATNYNSAYIRQLDERERELNGIILELKQAKDLAKKRETLASQVIQLRNKVEGLKIRVDSFLNAAREDMLNKKKDFDEVYFSLMKRADEHCYSAYIGEDYMPHINLGAYRERSAAVPKRLMYFLTMLIESLKNEANFPQFLMIDTPNKEGIDKENLIKNIGLLAEADKYTEEMKTQYQIILTTGIDTYPEEFKNNVFYKLEGENYLLQENCEK